jgi:hypothetical protein
MTEPKPVMTAFASPITVETYIPLSIGTNGAIVMELIFDVLLVAP